MKIHCILCIGIDNRNTCTYSYNIFINSGTNAGVVGSPNAVSVNAHTAGGLSSC